MSRVCYFVLVEKNENQLGSRVCKIESVHVVNSPFNSVKVSTMQSGRWCVVGVN